MAKRRARSFNISIPESEPDTRTRGPLIGDQRPLADLHSNALKGGEIFCSGVTRGRGVAKEAPRIKTFSSWETHYEQDRVFRDKENHES